MGCRACFCRISEPCLARLKLHLPDAKPFLPHSRGLARSFTFRDSRARLRGLALQRPQAAMVLTTMAFFVVGLVVNELVFNHFEFTRGVNWIYLPAGIRLLATLLFAEAGALGLLLV